MQFTQLQQALLVCPRCSWDMRLQRLGKMGHDSPYVIFECDNCGLVDGASGGNLHDILKRFDKVLVKDAKRYAARARHPRISRPECSA